MTPRKLDLMIATFSYGGNGGIRSAHPDVYTWLLTEVPKIKADPRIGIVRIIDLADTPITMTRNQAVIRARHYKADLLLMIDSDQSPDYLVGIESSAVPFWDSSFDFLCKHYERGPVMVAAPYCGPPPHELAYIFRWRTRATDDPNANMQLDMFTREEAAERTGIEPVAAVPTGLTLWDMRCFEVTEPMDADPVAQERDADYKPSRPWFYYEYTDKYESQKASTEDVTMTRDLSTIGEWKLGYNPVHINWDAWAGHWKPKNVGKPMLLASSDVATKYREAITRLPRDTRVHNFKSPIAEEISEAERTQLRNAAGLPPNNGQASVNGYTTQVVEDRSKPLPIVYDPARRFIIAGWETNPDDIKALQRIAFSVADNRNAPSDHILVAEIGSWGGGSALAIHEALGQRSHEIHCIDTWDGGDQEDLQDQIAAWGGPEVLFDVFRRNMGTLISEGYVFPHDLRSADAAAEFDFCFDMVFIDAGHEYDEVKADILAWLPKVREGGILCGHDYHDDWPGVVDAVSDLLGTDIKLSGYCIWQITVTKELKEKVLGVALCP